MENATLVTQAKQYIQERGYPGGVVLFFEGEQYGWKNALRNPESEKPGAIAIDSEGNQWKAVGGDDYNGAEKWEAINHNKPTDQDIKARFDSDPIYAEALLCVAVADKATASLLQRNFTLSYNRAMLLLERMETEGYISKPDSKGQRTVYPMEGI